jgi:RNA polymerase sigma factor (sigma-70 family)
MAQAEIHPVLLHIRRLVGWSAGDLTDRELLDRFVQRHEEAVFESLLQRHGPLVLGVCRRVLNHEEDAEDAFQATFLVLARKAASIRKQASLGSWLYGVAYRTALKLKARVARQRLHERRAADMSHPEAHDDRHWHELRPVLDEELCHLPEKYRLPLVLCYLEGKTNAEAARQLGWPSGSMAKRLMRGRELLRARLVRRGIALPVGALALLLTEQTRAAVPAGLLATSARAAVLTATGEALGGVVSTQVVSLAEGVCRTMFLSKLKTGMVFLLALGVFAAAGLAVHHLATARPAFDDPEDKGAQEVTTEKHPELALVPGDALGFIRVDVPDLWKMLQGLRSQIGEKNFAELEKGEKNLGVAITGLRSILAIALTPESNQELPALVVLTTKKPYERDKVLRALVPENPEEHSYSGQSYFTAKDRPHPAVSFVNDHVFLIGSAKVLEKYFDQRAARRGLGHLTAAVRVAEGQHALAGGFQVPTPLAEQLKKESSSPAAQFLRPLFDVQAGTVVMDAGKETSVRLRLQFPDADTARKATHSLETGLDMLDRQLTEHLPAEVKRDPTLFNPIQQGVAMLRTRRVEQQDGTVQVTMRSNAVPILVGLAIPAAQKMWVESDRMRSMNNLKQIALAMHNYADQHGHFPAADITDEEGRPLLSWRVAILPYIEQDALYRQFKLDEPWDGPNNKRLLAQMPPTYASPGMRTSEPGMTSYKVFTGKDTAFPRTKGVTFAEITDGTSNTLMAVELAPPVPWTKPEDIPYSAKAPLPKLQGPFPGGFLAAFCDGSVRFISSNVDEQTLRALITRNGGEVVNIPNMQP